MNEIVPKWKKIMFQFEQKDNLLNFKAEPS